jgi:hypothetical protein
MLTLLSDLLILPIFPLSHCDCPNQSYVQTKLEGERRRERDALLLFVVRRAGFLPSPTRST